MAADAVLKHDVLWLWIPAFAGTTNVGVANRASPMNDTFDPYSLCPPY
jgi:hypothetical protein